MSERLLKAIDIAQRLNISKAYAYLLIKRGYLPCLHLGKACRVRPEDLEQFIANNISVPVDKSVSLRSDSSM